MTNKQAQSQPGLYSSGLHRLLPAVCGWAMVAVMAVFIANILR